MREDSKIPCLFSVHVKIKLWCSPVNVEQSRIVSSHLPGRFLSIMQIKSTGFSPVTALIGEVVSTSGQRTQKSLKTTSCWQAAWSTEAQVPFAHHVCGISSFEQTLWKGRDVWGQAEGLAWTDDWMLEAGVNLVAGDKNTVIEWQKRWKKNNNELKFIVHT